MSYYYDIPEKSRSSSTGTKLIAVILILMIVLTGGMALLLRMGSNGIVVPPSERIKVAVLDSGLDIDYTLEGRVAEQQSFILPQYGYSTTDLTVTDSKPDGIAHGTVVAKTVVSSSSNTLIVNGKILGPEGTATAAALVAAIYWAVAQNCSVINLSLGSSPTFGDPLEEAVAWAFDHGAVVVGAGGNEDDNGLTGTSITSPSVFSKCIAVGAVDASGRPLDFTSHGPTVSGYMKPDISTLGYTDTADGRYLGTSFAAPRVSAAAADLIAYCQQNNISYTPGSIVTALLMGATELAYPEYIVGAGMLNTQNSINVIASNAAEGELPEIAYAHPITLPIGYEKLFYGDTYRFDLQLFTSDYTTFDVLVDAANTTMYEIADEVAINQTGFVPLKINVPASGPSQFDATITFASGFSEAQLDISFTASLSVARIAFDFSYTPWSIDSHYGQFRDYYQILVENDISVTEIQSESEITLEYLQEFDGVVLLDPFTWDLNETDPLNLNIFSLSYTAAAKQAYEDYYLNGGGIFIAALSNDSLDIQQLNEFIDWSGFSLGFFEIGSGSAPTLITTLTTHVITDGVGSFDYLGANVILPVGAVELARYFGRSVLAYDEAPGGGRIVVTGTNYFIDNWGMNGEYESSYNWKLALQITQWIADLL